jgi:hypothetical protein
MDASLSMRISWEILWVISNSVYLFRHWQNRRDLEEKTQKFKYVGK